MPMMMLMVEAALRRLRLWVWRTLMLKMLEIGAMRGRWTCDIIWSRRTATHEPGRCSQR